MTTHERKDTNIIWKFFLIFFAAIGLFSVGIVFIFSVAFMGMGSTEPINQNSILIIDLENGFPEYVARDGISAVVQGDPITLFDVLTAIKKAETDDRILGIVGTIGGSNGLAQYQELRDAIISFRNTGKPAFAFAESFGEFAPGNGAYYLATAFDEIFLQPTGDLNLIGLSSESMFYKGTLDKIGVKAEGDKRKEYKNAFNQYTENGYTTEHLESVNQILGSQLDQIVSGIAESRNLTTEEVYNLLDKGPFTSTESVTTRLVNKLGYRDEAIKAMLQKTVHNAAEISITSYINRSNELYGTGQQIALINVDGTILKGSNGSNPFLGDNTAGSESITYGIRKAVNDKKTKAIILRVNSPGGSHNASDTIRREIEVAKNAGIPVVVSMGNLAASGGYYVSLDANRIIAQPGTLTGSIGVYALKFVTKELWETIGISWGSFYTNENAGAYSTLQGFTDQQWNKFQKGLDRVYEDFTSKVANGRGMKIEEVLEVAKGRVWTGAEAMENGLVDELGGFYTAIDAAKELARISEHAPVTIEIFPEPKTTFDALMELGGISTGSDHRINSFTNSISEMRPFIKLMQKLISGEQNALIAPELTNIKH